ncbi:MAG: hypothetical protein P8P32_02385 [Akkermansiaceae bacterium]|nr:hypothetical protein [Akkermansiaceae bacterium]MDG2322644.1 hypothetical protein [Akkermansiaceae bacterium]
MSETKEPSKVSGIKITLAVIPALLIVSIIIALYLGANEEQEKQKPREGDVTIPELADFLEKLNHRIVERSFGSDEGVRGLKQTWSMIQGTLEPPNLGYEVFKKVEDIAAGKLWPTLWVNVGAAEPKEINVIAVPYGVSGTPVAFSLGLAEYYTMHKSKKGIRIAFYPPLLEGDPKSWIWERIGKEEESLESLLILEGGGSPLNWADIKTTEKSADILDQLVSKKGWAGNFKIADERAGEIHVALGEQGKSQIVNHAERLIRMMSVMKALLEQTGK